MCYTFNFKPKGRFPLHSFRTLGCEARFFFARIGLDQFRKNVLGAFGHKK